MSDIVERLREHRMTTDWQVAVREAHDAADEITRLRAEVERLRALEACETELAHDGDCPPEATANWKYAETCRLAAAEIARLSRDWDTVREAHDNLVCELDLRLTERRQQAAEIERLRAALREIAELPGEINPSNYTHDDVVTLNDAFVKTWDISRAALGRSDERFYGQAARNSKAG